MSSILGNSPETLMSYTAPAIEATQCGERNLHQREGFKSCHGAPDSTYRLSMHGSSKWDTEATVTEQRRRKVIWLMCPGGLGKQKEERQCLILLEFHAYQACQPHTIHDSMKIIHLIDPAFEALELQHQSYLSVPFEHIQPGSLCIFRQQPKNA